MEKKKRNRRNRKRIYYGFVKVSRVYPKNTGFKTTAMELTYNEVRATRDRLDVYLRRYENEEKRGRLILTTFINKNGHGHRVTFLEEV